MLVVADPAAATCSPCRRSSRCSSIAVVVVNLIIDLLYAVDRSPHPLGTGARVSERVHDDRRRRSRSPPARRVDARLRRRAPTTTPVAAGGGAVARRDCSASSGCVTLTFMAVFADQSAVHPDYDADGQGRRRAGQPVRPRPGLDGVVRHRRARQGRVRQVHLRRPHTLVVGVGATRRSGSSSAASSASSPATAGARPTASSAIVTDCLLATAGAVLADHHGLQARRTQQQDHALARTGSTAGGRSRSRSASSPSLRWPASCAPRRCPCASASSCSPRAASAPAPAASSARDPAQPRADDADRRVHRARHPHRRRGRARLPRAQRRDPDPDVGQADRPEPRRHRRGAGGRRCSRA